MRILKTKSLFLLSWLGFVSCSPEKGSQATSASQSLAVQLTLPQVSANALQLNGSGISGYVPIHIALRFSGGDNFVSSTVVDLKNPSLSLDVPVGKVRVQALLLGFGLKSGQTLASLCASSGGGSEGKGSEGRGSDGQKSDSGGDLGIVGAFSDRMVEVGPTSTELSVTLGSLLEAAPKSFVLKRRGDAASGNIEILDALAEKVIVDPCTGKKVSLNADSTGRFIDSLPVFSAEGISSEMRVPFSFRAGNRVFSLPKSFAEQPLRLLWLSSNSLESASEAEDFLGLGQSTSALLAKGIDLADYLRQLENSGQSPENPAWVPGLPLLKPTARLVINGQELSATASSVNLPLNQVECLWNAPPALQKWGDRIKFESLWQKNGTSYPISGVANLQDSPVVKSPTGLNAGDKLSCMIRWRYLDTSPSNGTALGLSSESEFSLPSSEVVLQGLGNSIGNVGTAPELQTVSTSFALVNGTNNPGLPLVGGTITLTGSNFSTIPDVTIGGAACSVTSATATQIQCAAPSQASGVYSVVVKQADFTSNVKVLEYVAKPIVSSLSVPTIPLNGGALSIIGSDFIAPLTVTIGGTACTSLTVVSQTQLVCGAPSKIAASYPVLVSDGYSQSDATKSVSYSGLPTITSVSPNIATELGGVNITITGTGFENEIGLGASLGGSNCVVDLGSFSTLNSVTSFVCAVTAGTFGTTSVTVTNPGGQQAALANGFSYVSPIASFQKNPSNSSWPPLVRSTSASYGFNAKTYDAGASFLSISRSGVDLSIHSGNDCNAAPVATFVNMPFSNGYVSASLSGLNTENWPVGQIKFKLSYQNVSTCLADGPTLDPGPVSLVDSGGQQIDQKSGGRIEVEVHYTGTGTILTSEISANVSGDRFVWDPASGTCSPMITPTLSFGEMCTLGFKEHVPFLPGELNTLQQVSISMSYQNTSSQVKNLSGKIEVVVQPALVRPFGDPAGTFLDYLQRTSSSSEGLFQPTSDCVLSAGMTASSCYFYGEFRKFYVEGITCANYFAKDNLDLWDWSCENSNLGTYPDPGVVFVGKFKKTTRVADFIDFANPANPSWKENFLEVRNGTPGSSSLYLKSEQNDWIFPDTPLVPLPNNFATNATVVDLDNADLGGGTYATKVYFIPPGEVRETKGYKIVSPKVALIIPPTAKLLATDLGDPECSKGNPWESAPGVNPPTAFRCLVEIRAPMAWVEGSLDANYSANDPSEAVISLYSNFADASTLNEFAQLRNLDLSGAEVGVLASTHGNGNTNGAHTLSEIHVSGMSAGIVFVRAGNSRFQNIKIGSLTGTGSYYSGTGLYFDGSGNNVLDQISISNVWTGIEILDSQNNHMNRVALTSMLSGIEFQGSQSKYNTVNGLTATSISGAVVGTINSAGDVDLLLEKPNAVFNSLVVNSNVFLSEGSASGGVEGPSCESNAGKLLAHNAQIFGSGPVVRSCTGAFAQTIPLSGYFGISSGAGDFCKHGDNVGSVDCMSSSLGTSGYFNSVTVTSTLVTGSESSADSAYDSNFVGGLTSADPKNATVTSSSIATGGALWSTVSDWTNFSKFLISWSRAYLSSGMMVFSVPEARDTCATGSQTCRPTDLSLNSTSIARNKTLWWSSGSNNGSFPTTSGSSCPTSVVDQSDFGFFARVTPAISQVPEFLSNAIEYVGDGWGNENGLCEAGERCRYLANLGADQSNTDATTGDCSVTGVGRGFFSVPAQIYNRD